jgi:hypothetical protein
MSAAIGCSRMRVSKRVSRATPLSALLLAAASFALVAPPARSADETVSPQSATNAPPLKQIGPGIFELGKVVLNKNERTVNVPVTVNMTEGNVEYFVVTTTGKTHESVFRTEAEPYHIQLAMLLLGATGRGTNEFPQEKTKPPPGDPVTIEVLWTNAGGQRPVRAESLIFYRSTQTEMRPVKWIYNGSQINDTGFAAQQFGSIVSMIDDPDALFNNPLPRRDDDDNWLIRTNAVQKLKSAAQLIISLEKADTKQ